MLQGHINLKTSEAIEKAIPWLVFGAPIEIVFSIYQNSGGEDSKMLALLKSVKTKMLFFI
jgi:hypothetical protein